MYSVASTIPLRRGAIVHTTLVSTTGADGGHTVNATNPYFYVIATDGDEGPYVGMQVDKMGSTTGWTTGTVNHTCADKTIAGTTYPDGPTQSPYAVRCAFEASAWVGGGDSGGPVFYRFDQTLTGGDVSGSNMAVALLGTAFAEETVGTGSDNIPRGNNVWFSSYESFHQSTGDYTMSAYTDASVGTPTLSGSLVGNSGHFSWNSVTSSGTTSTAAIQYYVGFWVTTTTQDEYGDIIESYVTMPVTLTTTTSTSFVDTAYSLYTTSTCGDADNPIGAYIAHYEVKAMQQGVWSGGSNTICFQ